MPELNGGRGRLDGEDEEGVSGRQLHGQRGGWRIPGIWKGPWGPGWLPHRGECVWEWVRTLCVVGGREHCHSQSFGLVGATDSCDSRT